MKEIKLTQNKVALVDDEDYEYLSQFKWYARKGRTSYYASRRVVIDEKITVLSMHTEIMGTPKGLECDHRDGNGLNNQRFNLRNCTRQQNAFNQSVKKTSRSKSKGVCWHKQNKNWYVHIKNPKTGKTEHCGTFYDETNAAKKYNEKAIEYYGEFARLNII